MFTLSLDLLTAIRHFFLIFGVMILAFLMVGIAAPYFHGLLVKFGLRKRLRQETADGKIASIFNTLHAKKEGTPTMGGILIWGTTMLIVLLSPFAQIFNLTRFSLINRNETYLPLVTLIAVALLGLIDDYLNVKNGKHKGLRVKPKFLWLVLVGLAGGLWFYYKLGYDLIHIPGFDNVTIGPWYIALFTFIIVASANAVNITDGLDGLAGGLVVIAFMALGIIAYLQGLIILAAFCAIIVGATLAFVWFNIPPALFYMGDTGSLALGATMGVIAMLTNSVIILPFITFIFVIETLSSIIQLASKKFLGRKIFKIAPLHHHLEASGWHEEQVVMRFWIIGGFMASLGIILGVLSLFSGA